MPTKGPHIDSGQPGEPVWSGPKIRTSESSGSYAFESASVATVTAKEKSAARSPRKASGQLEFPEAAKTRFRPPQTAPMPKRPKGRLFVGAILWSVAGLATFAVWDTFFRYEAHGVVAGRVITIAAPWDGVVKALHIREGETFRNGDLLVSLDNVTLRQQLDQLHDQLHLAQAELESKISELKYKTQLDDDRTKKATAELYELWGNVLRERATLIDLRATKARYAKIPRDSGLVTLQERQRVDIGERGQTAKVKKMIEALKEMQKRVDHPDVASLTHERDQLQPQIVRIDSIQKEITHIQAQVQQGEVRAVVDGSIVKRLHFTGEHVEAADGIFEVLEEDSKELVIYVRQETADEYTPDQQLHLRIDPIAELVRCRVARIGDVLVPAPAAIEHHYRKNAQLVPIFLEPEAEGYEAELRLGGEVKLPVKRAHEVRQWWRNTIHRLSQGRLPAGAAHEASM